MSCEHLSRVWTLCVVFCALPAACDAQGALDFHEKVAMMLKEEPENPKCFAGSKTDLTCFWEEDEEWAGSVDQYSFSYTYENEDTSQCPLRLVPAADGKTLFVCHLNQTQMFVTMDIQVHRDTKLIHNRSLLVELVFLLNPPANVTVSNTGKLDQLRVTWLPPPLKYMDDSMLYEVSYAAANSHVGQVEKAAATSECILRNLQPGTKYKVRVRVRFDGISYSGFWSSWSEPVFMETLPPEFNPLILSLTLIISFILVVLSVTILLSTRRFLTKKIWPIIPTPENKFQDLFTVYGGDFQEWLGHTNGGLWLTPAFFCSEERPSPLEVLSELSLHPSPPLLPKVSRASPADRKEGVRRLDETGNPGLTDELRTTSCDHWLIDRLRALHQHPMPSSHSSLLESQDTYVTLSNQNRSEVEHLDDILEETSPHEALFTSRKTALCESHSDLGSVQQNCSSGKLSSQSSFEFPNHSWAPKGLGYTYMAVADSGVSMDYSPMSRVDDFGKVVIYANEYKNEIPSHRRPFLPKHQLNDD